MVTAEDTGSPPHTETNVRNYHISHLFFKGPSTFLLNCPFPIKKVDKLSNLISFLGFLFSCDIPVDVMLKVKKCVYRSSCWASLQFIARIHLQCGRPGFDPWLGMIPLEKGMPTHSSLLAWRIPWTEEPGRLQSLGSQKVRQD